MMYGILVPASWDRRSNKRRWKLARGVFGPRMHIENFLISQQLTRPSNVTIRFARIVPLPMYGEP